MRLLYGLTALGLAIYSIFRIGEADFWVLFCLSNVFGIKADLVSIKKKCEKP